MIGGNAVTQQPDPGSLQGRAHALAVFVAVQRELEQETPIMTPIREVVGLAFKDVSICPWHDVREHNGPRNSHKRS
jgi:hypothetical protein